MDWTDPDYSGIYAQRAARLEKLREGDDGFALAKRHYRFAPWDFIEHWGTTYDPRLLESGKLSTLPFIPWPKQLEFLHWLTARWKAGKRGLVEKSRDCGVSWLVIGWLTSMWLFEPGFSGGLGSRKEDLVDRKGDPDSLFEKIRLFLAGLPREFMPKGWSPRTCSAFMRLANPESGGTLTGEAGDQIGRGGRKAVFVVDESAFVEHQDMVDAALSQNTNCQIDVSTPNGSGNAFYRKRLRFDGTDAVFVFDWRDDPRKDEAWYARQCTELDEVTVAQEIDRDYHASAEDVFIPARWVASAIDAHKVLGFDPTGMRTAGFDPSDVGDAKAVVCRFGSIVVEAAQRKEGDITSAIPWAFELADQFRCHALSYDADGMGAPSMKLALQHRAAGHMRVIAYHGSAAVLDPRKRPGEDRKASRKREREVAKLHEGEALRTNADTYQNFRAQSWSWVRDRFQLTHEAVTRAREGQLVNCDPDDLISLSTQCKDLIQLQAELSRPQRQWSGSGKLKVESKDSMKRRGVDSPNLADALVIAYAVRRPPERNTAPIRVRTQPVHDRAIGY